jgi:hypothetical protein
MENIQQLILGDFRCLRQSLDRNSEENKKGKEKKMDLRTRILLWAITPKSCITCGKPLSFPGAEHIWCAIPHWRLSLLGWVFWYGWGVLKIGRFKRKEFDLREKIIKIARKEN